MKIYRVTDEKFKSFGKVLDIDTTEIVKTGEKQKMPESGSVYCASYEPFEKLDNTAYAEKFGGLEMQMGYCYGYNDTLNALEWHTCSEINVAVTDLILLLGDVRDIEDGYAYDSSKVTAFKVLKGEAIEVYATTLHFCPIQTEKTGFGCAVGLLKGTNTAIEEKKGLLWAKNKWLIGHKDNEALKAKGAVCTIYGENYKL